jgi:protein-S-isoprenylcysteine O-methyltransferase
MSFNFQSDPTLLPTILGSCILISESFIILTKFTRSNSVVSGDRFSLLSIMGITFVSICLAVPFVFFTAPQALHFQLDSAGVILAFTILAIGMSLRWWSIRTLGAFFTVNVSAHDDHQLINGGPYALLRHPSYTGLLLEILALAISFQHVLSLLIIMVPTMAALVYRILIEERVLRKTLGDTYRSYQQKTYSLVPFVF